MELAFGIVAEPSSSFVGIMMQLTELEAGMVARTAVGTVAGLASVAGMALAATGSIVTALVEAVIGYSNQLGTAVAVIVPSSISSFVRSTAFVDLVAFIAAELCYIPS